MVAGVQLGGTIFIARIKLPGYFAYTLQRKNASKKAAGATISKKIKSWEMRIQIKI
jgi:hypothetical protein